MKKEIEGLLEGGVFNTKKINNSYSRNIKTMMMYEALSSLSVVDSKCDKQPAKLVNLEPLQ